MRVRAVLLAAALALAPLDVRAADLVVWWEKGWNPEEDQAVREIVAAFQQKTGKQIDLAVRSLGRVDEGHRSRAQPFSRLCSNGRMVWLGVI
jgi:ABC-type glycerol-3-phosphate transport system substrate-binding protein